MGNLSSTFKNAYLQSDVVDSGLVDPKGSLSRYFFKDRFRPSDYLHDHLMSFSKAIGV